MYTHCMAHKNIFVMLEKVIFNNHFNADTAF